MEKANVLLVFHFTCVGERCGIPGAQMLSFFSISQLENLPVCEELRDGQWRMVTVRVATALLCGTCFQLVLKLALISSYR